MGKGLMRSLCERAPEDQALPSQHAVFFFNPCWASPGNSPPWYNICGAVMKTGLILIKFTAASYTTGWLCLLSHAFVSSSEVPQDCVAQRVKRPINSKGQARTRSRLEAEAGSPSPC